MNIDSEDQPTVPNSNPRKWWEQIGKVLTPTGAWGLAATPDPLKMVFTNGNRETDGSGFGVLTVKDDPINWAPTTLYTNLTLGSDVDFFDVNEGVAVTVTADGKYAFVAGRNTRGNTGSDPLAGGNIGIIQDPLGPNPKLVAATEPVPGSLTNNVALSSDGKYLIGSYPTLSGGGSAYVFDAGEIIKTLENPGDYWIDGYYRGRGNLDFQPLSQRRATLNDLTRVPIEELNPLVLPQNSTPAIPTLIASISNPLGLLVATKPPSFKEQIEKLLKAGAIANYDRLIALIIKTNDQNDLKSVVGNATMRDTIVNSFSSKPEMATVVMAALLKGSQEWKNPTANGFVRHFEVDKKTTLLSYNDSMNCWEMILYAAFLCGQMTASQIRNFFKEAKYNFPIFSGMPIMGYQNGLPFYPNRGLPYKQTRLPKPGQLVFFTDKELKNGELPEGDPGHVAIALNSTTLVSLWDRPNNNNHIQIIDVSKIKGYVQVGQSFNFFKGILW